METLTETLAKEAAAPAVGLINAALGPKIKRISAWAKENEINSQVSPKALNKSLTAYFEKLSARACEITSITFPQRKIDIFETYEPLRIREQDHAFPSFLFGEDEGQLEIQIDSLLNPESANYIIIDSAGMGKSTFCKYIVTNLLYKSERIPILFELRKINDKESLLEHLARELDFPGNTFNRDVFYKLISLGKLYIILDGFDEINIEEQERIATEIFDLSSKGGKNILLLTSRAQDALPELMQSKPMCFIPFSEEQTKSLLDRYDRIANQDIGQRLKKEINKIPSKFLESPLLVSLLYRTFGVNNSIAERMSTFYDEIYDALYKGHDLLNKNTYTRKKKSELDFEDFRKLLRSLCFYTMLNRKTSYSNANEATEFISQAIHLSSSSPKSAYTYLDDLKVSVPLIQRDGNELKFLHKTILEYFSAEYIIFSTKSRENTEKILNSNLAPSFEKTFEFLEDISPNLFDNIITKRFALELKNENIPNKIEERIIATALYTCKCEIGLWPVAKYGQDNMGDGKYNPNELVFEERSTNRFSWEEVTVNGELFFLVIGSSPIRRNFHHIAWKKLAKKAPSRFVSEDDKTADISSLEKAIKKEQWTELDKNLTSRREFKHYVILNMLHMLIFERGYRRNGEVNILCPKKITKFLESEEEKEELETRLDQFF